MRRSEEVIAAHRAWRRIGATLVLCMVFGALAFGVLGAIKMNEDKVAGGALALMSFGFALMGAHVGFTLRRLWRLPVVEDAPVQCPIEGCIVQRPHAHSASEGGLCGIPECRITKQHSHAGDFIRRLRGQ